MAVYSLEQLSSMVDALTARVNAIDGAGLPDPSQSLASKTNASINGFKTTLSDTALVLEQELQQLQQQVANLQAQLKVLQGGQ